MADCFEEQVMASDLVCGDAVVTPFGLARIESAVLTQPSGLVSVIFGVAQHLRPEHWVTVMRFPKTCVGAGVEEEF